MTERTTMTAIPVTAVRYNVSRWTVAQALVPFTMLAAVAARRVPSSATIAASVVLLSATGVAFARARCSLGRQTLLDEGGKLRLQGSGEELTRKTIGRWTSRAGVARLHGTRTSYRLKVDEPYCADLDALLTRALGSVSATTHRGSPRARAWAAVAFAIGVITLGLAVGFQSLPLLLVGVPLAVLGGAVFGALSQRIVR